MEQKTPSMWQRIKTVIHLLLNWRFLICFGIAWLITNGWSYLLLGVGLWTDTAWMIAVAGTYLAFLWLPISPEKAVTCAIALVLVRFLFPRHQAALKQQVKLIFQTRKRKVRTGRADNPKE